MALNNLEQALSFFVVGFLELSVLFLGVSLLVEVINSYINPTKVQRLLSSSKSGYFLASFLGSVTPFCSCSTIPLTLGLIKSRAAFGPIMTFLFTSPLLNPIIIIVFYIAFGWKVTLIYALIAFFASLLAGFTLEKLGFEKYIKKEDFLDEPVNSCCDTQVKEESCCAPTTNFTAKKEESCCTSKPTFSTKKVDSCCSTPTTFTVKKEESCCTPKVEENSSCGLDDNSCGINTDTQSSKKKIFTKALVKKTWKQFLSFVPYIAIGIGIGAFVHGFVPQDLITKYGSADNIFAVPFSAIVGIPLYIRAETMVGLAPELIDKGVNMGSILALTIAGAGASLPEMIMLKKIFKAPIMIFFILSVFTMAIGCGYLVNLYFA